MDALITELKKAHSVRLLCRLLEVSSSTYYRRQKAPLMGNDPELMAEVKAIHKTHRRSYGTRRMAAELRRRGHAVGRYRARTLMRQAQVWSDRKRRHRYKKADKPAQIAPNLLNREFHPKAPNQAWAGDITYVPTPGGWLYLAIVVDLYARRIVGWSCSRTPDTPLVLAALNRAREQRPVTAGLLFHSDQGCQYTSIAFCEALQQGGIRQSMSRRGNCWDNAVVERVFRTLKHEWLKEQDYRHWQDVYEDVKRFADSYYNHRRLHSTNDYQPPAIIDALAL